MFTLPAIDALSVIIGALVVPKFLKDGVAASGPHPVRDALKAIKAELLAGKPVAGAEAAYSKLLASIDAKLAA